MDTIQPRMDTNEHQLKRAVKVDRNEAFVAFASYFDKGGDEGCDKDGALDFCNTF
jgi:hypothetical protein